MIYRKFGRTGLMISRLGFGAMRLPMRREEGGGDHVVMADAVAAIRRGLELGVNYVDTAYGYCAGESELAVGQALRDGWRDRVLLSTKLPVWQVKSRADFRKLLDEQLGRLQTDRIDFYHLHALGAERFRDIVLKFDLIDEAVKARGQGLIRFLSFSFHDRPEAMIPIIDTGAFDSVLCQYNMLDQANAEAIRYARAKGLGVVAMGPVGGGRLAFPGGVFEAAVGGRLTTPELALRFVLDNPDIDCALSGMGNLQMVEDNVRVTDMPAGLAPDEQERLRELIGKCRELAKIYCTGCAYCMPCPAGVNIPVCFEALIYRQVYRLEQAAADKYRAIGGGWIEGKTASACTGCGACEKKCPQRIPIRERLRETAAAFGK